MTAVLEEHLAGRKTASLVAEAESVVSGWKVGSETHNLSLRRTRPLRRPRASDDDRRGA